AAGIGRRRPRALRRRAGARPARPSARGDVPPRADGALRAARVPAPGARGPRRGGGVTGAPAHALEYVRGPYTISTDQGRIDLLAVHRFLAGSYWASGVPLEVVARSIRGSLCFGVYRGRRQVGFARVISDGATFAYLADVFVLPAERGRGLASW